MRHAEYISTARRLIKSFSNRTGNFTLNGKTKLAILRSDTNWSMGKCREIVSQLEDTILPLTKTEMRLKTKKILSLAESQVQGGIYPSEICERILQAETNWPEDICKLFVAEYKTKPKKAKRIKGELDPNLLVGEKISFD